MIADFAAAHRDVFWVLIILAAIYGVIIIGLAVTVYRPVTLVLSGMVAIAVAAHYLLGLSFWQIAELYIIGEFAWNARLVPVTDFYTRAVSKPFRLTLFAMAAVVAAHVLNWI